MVIKRDRVLLVKLFYLNGSKSSVALREYHRIKGLKRGPVSTNGLKKIMMMKFKNTGGFGVAPRRGRQPISMEVVVEFAVVVAGSAERAPNSATSAQAVSCELGVPLSKVRKILHCILQ